MRSWPEVMLKDPVSYPSEEKIGEDNGEDMFRCKDQMLDGRAMKKLKECFKTYFVLHIHHSAVNMVKL